MDAIESVRRQTFTGWRLIVVDDASDDGSVDSIRRIVDDDPRMGIVMRRESGGPQVARQSGFEASVAPYIAILDSDDVWEPAKLEKQLALFQAERKSVPDLGAILCWHQWTDLDGRVSGPIRKPPAHGRVNPLVSNNMSTILVRREALASAGGFLPRTVRPLSTCEGVEFYIRLTQWCAFAVVPERLVWCRHHAGPRANWTSLEGQAAQELAYVIALHEGWLSRHPEDLARLRARLGARQLAAGRRREGVRQMRLAVRDAGFRAGWPLMRRYGPFAVKAIAGLDSSARKRVDRIAP